MPTWLASRLVIDHLAFRVRNYRHLRKGLRNMALEIKGLKAKALKAAANLDRLNAAYDKFNEAAPAHAADVEGLAPQLEALADDLTFAAQTLGNSVNGSGGSEQAKEPPKPSPAVIQPHPAKNESTASPSPPAVGQTTSTFPGQ